MEEVRGLFSIRLKELRSELNLSHQKIADYLGIAKASYGFYEQGRNYPNTEILIKIADLFNVSIDYLLGRTINKEVNK